MGAVIPTKGHQMVPELNDNTGASVTVRLDEARPVGTYTVHETGGPPVGRADFLDAPGGGGERIFFHTEVDRAFAGRGLAGLLVREALADSVRRGLTVVPVCPLFANHLEKHGDEFVAGGGTFRRATDADIALVKRSLRSDA